ncbi:TetR/AcrR family transcriptional regulator [Sporosarcina sp. CAU 1771]
MPKLTFFNLSEEKQNVLLNAAKKEFSRVPLHEAVISNIIKNADISRGSFYQYFENLEDLFFYILDKHVKRNEESFVFQLKKNNGDILNTFIGLFQLMLDEFQTEENRVFFKNAFLNMNHKMGNAFSNSIQIENIKNQHSELMKLIDIKKLNIENENEVVHVLKIIKAVTFQNLVHSFAAHLSPEEALKNYISEINILKKGIYR